MTYARYKGREIRSHPEIPTLRREDLPEPFQDWFRNLEHGGVRQKARLGASVGAASTMRRLRRVSIFMYYLGKIGKGLNEFTRRDANNFRIWAMKKFREGTARIYMTDMQSFYEHAIISELDSFGEINPFHRVNKPPPPRNFDSPFSCEEKRLILDYLWTRVRKGYKFAWRDLCQAVITLKIGRRKHEIQGLTIDDIKFDTKELVFKVKKGEKKVDDPVPWTSSMIGEACEGYVLALDKDPTCVGPGKTFDGRLFPYKSPECYNPAFYTIGVNAGVERRIYPHLGRATVATDLYELTLDDDFVRLIGGWSPNSNVFKRYIRRRRERILNMPREYLRQLAREFDLVKPYWSTDARGGGLGS